MLIGDSSMFAVESRITTAWESLRWRGTGFFVLHVAGAEYGLRGEDSASLGCHVLNLKARIAERGKHVAPFAEDPDPNEIAFAFRNSTYADGRRETHFGLSVEEFLRLSRSSDLDGLTVGMEAFDDGSEVLQFDVGNAVRLVAYKSGQGWEHDPSTLHEIRLDADVFYGVLQSWIDAFEVEWTATPKSPNPL